MFTIYHIIWICICAAIITVSLIYINKRQVPLSKLLPVCCIVSVVSEVIKTMSVFKMVPSTDGTLYFPYLELQYLPFHMCSLLILVILYCTYGQNEKLKNDMTGFLFAAGVLGGIMGIALPSIFSSVKPENSFTSPLAYQTFLYHTMLIILGVTLFRDKNSTLTSKNFKSTMIILVVLTFLSLYINSIFAVPVYKDSVLQSVEYTTNFFFTYRTPIGIKLETKGQWYLYLAIISVIAVVLVYLLYIPVFRRDRKNKYNN